MPEPREPDRATLAAGEPGAARAKWIAAALVVALVAWMASGLVLPSEEPEARAPVTEAVRRVTVAVRTSDAAPVTRYFAAEGQAEPDRVSMVRSEASGEVVEVRAREGRPVAAGEVLAQIDRNELEADREQAREELARAEREFQNAEALLERGSATVDRLAEARTALAAARARIANAEQAIEDTLIRAPFAGTLEALTIEVGEFVAAGEEVGEVVDAVPLTVQIRVPQQSLSQLAVGQEATVSFITGQEREGEVAFVGTRADAETRTFRAEVVVPNEVDPVPAGVSAEVRIPVGESVAHLLSPAILSLGADGTLGVKTVGADATVAFHPVEIVRAQADGVWVAGLPETARIITVGQGFVSAGEAVEAVEEDALDTTPRVPAPAAADLSE
jgi:multidrug efflux system membrane fusion protein